MKKFLKTLAVIAAVAALGFGFASCSDGDGGDSGPSALAAFTYTKIAGGNIKTIYFYADNTWVRESVFPQVNNYTQKDMRGTYAIADGDFTNGKLNFTVVEKDRKKLDWKEVSLEINNGVFYLDVHESSPIVEVNEESLDKYEKK